MPIQELPPHVAAQIAAGEVVERPAAAVKELVENSLDAGAGRILVSIRQGGMSEIRITDDGSGIPAEELELAFRHHATSKISAEADLNSVRTLGFRGEALPSIAAVSRVSCTTRTANAEMGARIDFRYGEPTGRRDVGAPVGTNIVVSELFGNVPARRRFLRSAPAETARVNEVVTRYALAFPEVRFTLVADDRELLSTPGSGSQQDAILALYGSEVAAAMLPVCGAEGETTVSGYIGAPPLSRHNRSYVTLLVNRRWVHHRSISYAIEQAYQGALPNRRYPVAVLDITMPPADVDVNSHPAKREVRFRNENRLFAIVQGAVRDALQSHAPARRSAGSFASTGGATADSPGADAVAGLAAPGPARGIGSASAPGMPGGPEQPPLSTVGLAPRGGSLREVIAGLRVVGQIRQTYIVAEGEAGMYLVDQHAAHERVVYDRMQEEAQRAAPVAQPLLTPAPVELDAAQTATLTEYAELLARQGFEIEEFGGNAWLVRSVPATLALRRNPDPAQALTNLLNAVAIEQVVMQREEALAATIACHGSVRAGDTLTLAEMDALLRQLETTANPHHCPHGRPTVIHFTEYQLEREFGRR